MVVRNQLDSLTFVSRQKTALACLMLAIAGLVSGRLKLFQRPKYIQADATVTSVEQVRYGDESRWKVRFAYFDVKGNAQDSVDEVNDPSWKAGDDCRAIYRPQTPDLATLQRGDRGLTQVCPISPRP